MARVGAGRVRTAHVAAGASTPPPDAPTSRRARRRARRRSENETTAHPPPAVPPARARYAVIGGGLTGAAVVYHVVRAHIKRHGHAPRVDLYDALGLAGGATAACSGLLHPLAPSGAPLWNGEAGCRAAEALVRIASAGNDGVARRTGALRVAKHEEQAAQFAALWGPDGRCVPDGIRGPWTPRLLSRNEARQFLPLIDMPTNAALFVPGARVINASAYVARLVETAHRLATSSGGGEVRVVRERVDSATSLGREYDGVVIAAGAAVGSLTDVSAMTYDAWKQGGDDNASVVSVPLQLCHGEAVHLSTSPESSLNGLASLLGTHYVAMPVSARHGAAVGATRRQLDGIASIAPSALRPVPDPEAAAYMLDAAAARWPPLRDESTSTRTLVAGVRASSPRTQHGCVPLVGRAKRNLTGCAPVWLCVAMGARGLVYHALVGFQLANALVNGQDDEVLDREFTRHIR